MSIIAAAVVTLKKAPTLRLVKDGTLPAWSGYAMAGPDGVSITAFGTLAEALEGLHLGVGDALTVTGTLTLATWDGKDGGKHSGLKLIASKAEPITPSASKKETR